VAVKTCLYRGGTPYLIVSEQKTWRETRGLRRGGISAGQECRHVRFGSQDRERAAEKG